MDDFFFLIIRQPPGSTRTDTLFPYTTLFRSRGLPLDTERFFVICVNVLGGCMGSTGPKSLDPATGEPWALDFPVITVADMVRAQKLLIDRLGIDKLFCVIGGSMGGMQEIGRAHV